MLQIDAVADEDDDLLLGSVLSPDGTGVPRHTSFGETRSRSAAWHAVESLLGLRRELGNICTRLPLPSRFHSKTLGVSFLINNHNYVCPFCGLLRKEVDLEDPTFFC